VSRRAPCRCPSQLQRFVHLRRDGPRLRVIRADVSLPIQRASTPCERLGTSWPRSEARHSAGQPHLGAAGSRFRAHHVRIRRSDAPRNVDTNAQETAWLRASTSTESLQRDDAGGGTRTPRHADYDSRRLPSADGRIEKCWTAGWTVLSADMSRPPTPVRAVSRPATSRSRTRGPRRGDRSAGPCA
jgi:hypothetical protein